ARMTEGGVIGIESGADGAAAITGSGLDEQLAKRCLADDSTVGHAVEGDATGEAEVGESCALVEGARHGEQGVLGHPLNAGGDVRVVLVLAAELGVIGRAVPEIARIAGGRKEGVGPGSTRAAKEPLELAVERGVRRTMVGEVLHVEREAAVVVECQELADVVDVLRLSVGRHAHDLVLALVDLEAEERGKDAVEESERVWEA